MKKYLNLYLSNSLLKGSTIMVFGSLSGSFVNYITNMLVGRMLGPSEYGVFTSLISLLMILSVFNTSVNTTVMKFVATFKAKKDLNSVESLWSQFTKIFFILGGVIFLIVAFLSPFLANYLKIEATIPVIILGVIIWVSLLAAVSYAVLNGLQQFFKLTFYQFLGSIVKLAVSVGLVYAGFKAGGALLGFLAMHFIPFALSAPFVKKLSNTKIKKVEVSLKEPFLYSLPVTLATLGLTLLYTMDVVLAKRYLTPFDAGFYGGLSVIGRVVMFGTSPLTLVMFPIISERVAQGRGYKKVLFFSTGLVALGGLFLSTIYFIFPLKVINVFFGSRFYSAAPFLGYFGVLLTLYSLCNLLTQFHLSINHKKVWIFTIVAALAQFVGIMVYHNSILQVLSVSFFAVGLLLLFLFIYTFFSNSAALKEKNGIS